MSMKISPVLVGAVKSQVEEKRYDCENKLMDIILSSQEKARSVIAGLPALIADAYCTNRNYADVGELIEPWGTPGFPVTSGEPLYFLKKNDSLKDRYSAKPPSKKCLIGASRLVFDYCKENGLSPKLSRTTLKIGTWNRVVYQWRSSKMTIEWRRKEIEAVLKISPFGSFDIGVFTRAD